MFNVAAGTLKPTHVFSVVSGGLQMIVVESEIENGFVWMQVKFEDNPEFPICFPVEREVELHSDGTLYMTNYVEVMATLIE